MPAGRDTLLQLWLALAPLPCSASVTLWLPPPTHPPAPAVFCNLLLAALFEEGGVRHTTYRKLSHAILVRGRGKWEKEAPQPRTDSVPSALEPRSTAPHALPDCRAKRRIT